MSRDGYCVGYAGGMKLVRTVNLSGFSSLLMYEHPDYSS
jgi:hypothetical protein